MPAQVRTPARDDHQMAESGRDLLLAAGAHIGLAGLERMDPAHLHLGGVDGVRVHRSIFADQLRRPAP
jgi:hypothetical protein